MNVALFAALAKEAKQCLGQFNVQDPTDMAWVFARLSHLDEALFAALARDVKLCQFQVTASKIPAICGSSC